MEAMVSARKAELLWKAVEVGVCAAAALGFVNRAAHVSDVGLGLMHGSLGLLAAFCAFRLAEKAPPGLRPPAGSAEGCVGALGALLAAGTYLDGRVLWAGGAWLASLGALGALACAAAARPGLTPALPGAEARGPYRVVRRPIVIFFMACCAGVLLVCYSGWNAAILAGAALGLLLTALAEERALSGAQDYRGYAAGVRWILIPGIK